jgi:hypothetical protein
VWGKLPESVKAEIVAMVNAAAKKESQTMESTPAK